MKTIKAAETIVITGIFRKRYWQVIPGVAVYELDVNTVKRQKKELQNAQAK